MKFIYHPSTKQLINCIKIIREDYITHVLHQDFNVVIGGFSERKTAKLNSRYICQYELNSLIDEWLNSFNKKNYETTFIIEDGLINNCKIDKITSNDNIVEMVLSSGQVVRQLTSDEYERHQQVIRDWKLAQLIL